MSDSLGVAIEPILRFFDEKPEGSGGHATAIVAVLGEDLGAGLLTHYFRSEKWRVEVFRKRKPANQKPLTPTGPGARLDRWMHVHRERESHLYQVEIKNWSAHAIGGSVLNMDADPKVVAKYKQDAWAKQWDSERHKFRGKMGKVLSAMTSQRKLPPERRMLKPRPLACYWTALHPSGHKSPLFDLRVEGSASFSRVWVFSMSAYLRQLWAKGLRKVRLEMPDAAARLRWLEELIY